MDLISILSQAVVPALGAAATLIAAEQAPDDKVPVTADKKKTTMTLLGAVVVILSAVQAAQEGRVGTINPEEVVAALGIAYAASMGLVAGFRAYLKR